LQDRSRQPFTTRAIERKGIHQGRLETLVEGLTEQPSSPVQSCLHRFLPNAEQVGRFFDAHFLDCPHHENNAELLRQFVDRTFEESANLALCCGPFRVRVRRQWKQNHLRHIAALAIQYGQIECWPPSAQSSNRFIDYDASEPGGEAGAAAKIGETDECAQIGFLNSVLGVAVASQHASGDPVKAPVVSLHDRAKRGSVILTRQT